MSLSICFFMFFIVIIIYTYFIYPAALCLASKFMRGTDIEESVEASSLPDVTFLIPGHNICHLVDDKIENVMKLNYEGGLSFLFVLDGCTDGTEELLNSYVEKGTEYPINIYATAERNGKEAAIRGALEHVKTEVMVFSDSDAMLETDCVEKLVKKLMRDGVGAVSGREVHEKGSDSDASEGQGLFYQYEEFIKKHLTRVGSLPYIQGGNFAMLKSLYPDNVPAGCTQDGIIAFDVVRKGYEVAYEPSAVSREDYNLSNDEDFSRRIRTITRAFYSILCRPQILNPFQTKTYFLHILSGRLFRWFTLFFAFGASSAGLFSGVELLQGLTFFGLVLWAALYCFGRWCESNKRRYKIPYFIYYFTYIHAAAAVAVLKVISGSRTTTWKPSN